MNSINDVSRPIEVVVIFDKEGSIKPLRFRIQTEDLEEKVIYIKRLLKMDKMKMNGYIVRLYSCEIILNGIKRNCELLYNQDLTKWILYKI